MTHRRRVVAVLLALAVAVPAAGCGRTSSPVEGGTTDEEEGPVDERPPMEEVLDRYEELQRELVEALTADPGGLSWGPAEKDRPFSRSLCPDDGEGAESGSFQTLVARGAYEGEARDRSSAVVQEVAARYGFDDVTVVVDRPDDLSIVIEDQYGGRVYYGTAVNTTLLVMTGCHVWTDAPGPDYERPPVLEGPAG